MGWPERGITTITIAHITFSLAYVAVIIQSRGGGREAEVALEWLTKQHADLAPEQLAGLNWLSALLLERRRKCAEDLDTKVRASFRRTAEKLEERLAIMRSEQNLLVEQPYVTFARTLGNLTEAHATDLLMNLGQIASLDHAEQLHKARITAKRLRYLLEPIRAYADKAQSVVKRSKRLQDVLGDECGSPCVAATSNARAARRR
jgi:CHAD domain-containing protein